MCVCVVLEVHQFSRDAGVAEAWLLGQEPYLSSREVGQSVDEVEKLIKRHEAFEKSAATWEERFSALERLTTVRYPSHAMKSFLIRRGFPDMLYTVYTLFIFIHLILGSDWHHRRLLGINYIYIVRTGLYLASMYCN